MKKLIILCLGLLIFGGTFGAFAYWDLLVKKEEDRTVTIGQGLEITVTDETAGHAGKKLVPSTAILKENDVKSLVFTYQVQLDTATTIKNMELGILVDNININDDDTHANLVGVVIELKIGGGEYAVYNPASKLLLVDGTTRNTVDVRITITLTEPATKEIYDLIKNQNITFDVTFTAIEVQP